MTSSYQSVLGLVYVVSFVSETKIFLFISCLVRHQYFVVCYFLPHDQVPLIIDWVVHPGRPGMNRTVPTAERPFLLWQVDTAQFFGA